MLDRTKVLKELVAASSLLFDSYAHERVKAHAVWIALCADSQKIQEIKDQEWPFLVPDWPKELSGQLGGQVSVASDYDQYTVFAIDGSQIYPDRHQGVACYLINIGTAFFRYGGAQGTSKAQFRSEPTIKIGYEGDEPSAQEVIADIVNSQRTELELQTAVKIVMRLKDSGLFLFDGSLIFWHLDSKETVVKNQFLTSYLVQLEQLYQRRALYAGYISLPKSRELVNLLRAATTDKAWFARLGQKSVTGHILGEQCFGSLVDSDIAHFFLKKNHRTIVFENQSPIVEHYSKHVRPHFFYLNNGTEIARIEIPAWIADDEALVEKIAQIAINQSVKGRGYPICLAEAHDQAVVKAADREFFYHILQKYALDRGQAYQVSRKSIQKQGVGI
jgi:hypothetical protein